uniref:GCR096 n=1 Tax=Schmidtea mediterranea TaxID=79327 RepID=A0A193KUL9_SCHMD|nr:GCR096 [Schmidtea mediterranea]
MNNFIEGTQIITIIVISFGIIGNFLSVIVLKNKVMRSSVSIYLLALTLWDTVLLICALFIGPLMRFENLRVIFFKIFYPPALVAQTATIWITVGLTCERYFAVCFPLKAQFFISMKKSFWCVILISLFSIFYNVPRWLEEIPMSINNSEHTFVNHSDSTIGFHKFYYSYAYIVIMFFIPLLVLSSMNYMLIRELKNSQLYVLNDTNKSLISSKSRRIRSDNNVTRMIVVVVSIFIFCQFPALIYNIKFGIQPANDISWEIISEIRNFLVILNSAVNFILYCAFGQKFRRTFVHVIIPCNENENVVNRRSLTNNVTNTMLR